MDAKVLQRIEDFQNELQAQFPGITIEVHIGNLDSNLLTNEVREKISEKTTTAGMQVLKECYGYAQFNTVEGKRIWLNCKPVVVGRLIEVPVEQTEESPII